jgi:hypothetical protein
MYSNHLALKEVMNTHRYQYTAYVSLRIILRFKLDKSFAVDEQTTFDAMSQSSGLSVMNVKRVVRHAILNHRFFQERLPGIITHSGPSAVLASDELARNAMIVQLEEFIPAGTRVRTSSQVQPNIGIC